MLFVFAWDDWNRQHVTKHGSNEGDAQYIFEHASDPFPRELGGNKYLVWGQTESGRYLEVVFAFKLPEELEFASLEFLDWSSLIVNSLIDYPATVAIYICQAMPMKAKQLRQYRKLRKES